jgi:hypothetical protein
VRGGLQRVLVVTGASLLAIRDLGGGKKRLTPMDTDQNDQNDQNG